MKIEFWKDEDKQDALCSFTSRINLLHVAGRELTRDFIINSVEGPLVKLLKEKVDQGTIRDFTLEVDRSLAKREQGICDIRMIVTPTVTPAGPAGIYVLELDVPEFKPAGQESGNSPGTPSYRWKNASR
jgi:hypothetical protein